jgi:predicted XRE-type DNA-binding protein
MNEENDIHASSGNVYADLGFDDPDLELVKADLAIEICRIISARGWSETEAATALGIDGSTLSNLVRGRLGDVSPEHLMHYLNRLNLDVRIVIAPNHSSQRSARLTVELHR